MKYYDEEMQGLRRGEYRDPEDVAARLSRVFRQRRGVSVGLITSESNGERAYNSVILESPFDVFDPYDGELFPKWPGLDVSIARLKDAENSNLEFYLFDKMGTLWHTVSAAGGRIYRELAYNILVDSSRVIFTRDDFHILQDEESEEIFYVPFSEVKEDIESLRRDEGYRLAQAFSDSDDADNPHYAERVRREIGQETTEAITNLITEVAGRKFSPLGNFNDDAEEVERHFRLLGVLEDAFAAGVFINGGGGIFWLASTDFQNEREAEEALREYAGWLPAVVEDFWLYGEPESRGSLTDPTYPPFPAPYAVPDKFVVDDQVRRMIGFDPAMIVVVDRGSPQW